MARWQLSASAVTIVPFNVSISRSFGTAVISFDLASVAICASTALLAAPRADHVQGRLAAGAIEGAAQNLAVNRHDTLNRIGETGHEPLEGSTEPLRIEQPEQPTEGVMAGQAVLQLEKAAQKGLFRFRKPLH